jgi:hypothetical protein
LFEASGVGNGGFVIVGNVTAVWCFQLLSELSQEISYLCGIHFKVLHSLFELAQKLEIDLLNDFNDRENRLQFLCWNNGVFFEDRIHQRFQVNLEKKAKHFSLAFCLNYCCQVPSQQLLSWSHTFVQFRAILGQLFLFATDWGGTAMLAFSVCGLFTTKKKVFAVSGSCG